MHLEIFTLCDAATVAGGKLNILGAFDTIHARSLPGVHPQCALALRIRFSRLEEGDHNVNIHLVNEDGKPVMPNLNGTMKVQFSAHDNTAVTNFIINIHQLKFEKFGEYSFDLALDGDHRASLPLFVKSADKQNEPAGL